MICITARPDPLVLIFLVTHTQLLQPLVRQVIGREADLRERLTFLPLSTVLGDGFVAEVARHAFEGVVAKDEAADGDEKQLGEHCQRSTLRKLYCC